MSITIRKGLDLPLDGTPSKGVEELPRPTKNAITPPDFRGLKLRLDVKEGDRVRTGSPLFHSKTDPRIRWTAPATGTVSQIRRGQRRAVEAVVIETAGEEQFETGETLDRESLDRTPREKIVERLLAIGAWPLVRSRPFDRLADPDKAPSAILVSALRKDAFHPDPSDFLSEREDLLAFAFAALKRLSDGPVYLTVEENTPNASWNQIPDVEVRRFSGPYPKGNPAVQVFHLCPPAPGACVWTLDVQDLLTLGTALQEGRWNGERWVTLAGPGVRAEARKVYRTRLGASVAALTQGRLEHGEMRFISGGLLNGRQIAADGFLGFHDSSIHVLPEGRWREMLSFVRPGFDRFSVTRSFLSAMLPGKRFAMDTNRRGSVRPFIQSGVYESVCPVELLPAHVAKSVLAQDFEEMERHGILDCAQCGLCSFVCPSKIEVAEIIQGGIDLIEKEG